MNTKEILQGIKDWSDDKLGGKVDKTTTVNGHALSGNVTVSKSNVGLGNVTNDAQVKRSEMGVASGVATLDSAGKVPSSQLPSYVDDVLEYNTKSAFPTTGEAGKIYVDKSTNTTWRWSGSAYTQIKGDLVIGTTTGTAADGGVASSHYSNTSNPHSVTKAQVGLGSVVNTGDSATPVSGGTTKFTTGGAYTELNKKVDKVSGKGLSTNDYTTDEKNKLSGIASGAEVNQNAFSNVGVKVGNTTTTVAADAKTDTVTLIQGSNVTLTADTTNDTVTIAAKDTTYSAATTTAAGLMSADDKTKLNGIAAGAEVNVQSDWNATSGDAFIKNKPTVPAAVAVKGNAETNYRTGNVNITPANIGLGNVNNTADANKNVASAAKLTTARSLWGQDFNGTGNVSGALTDVGNITSNVAANTDWGIFKLGEPIFRVASAGLVISPYDKSTGFVAIRTGANNITSGEKEIRLLNDGKVGIGTANPSKKLDVNGTLNVSGDATLTSINGVTVGSSPKFTDTTYSSKSAASGGTDVSLVTTGEKYAWNNKTSNTGTVTSVAVKMNGATKGTVTTSGTIDLGTVLTSHQDISGKADKSATVSSVAYNTTSKKITKTINGTTSDVVTAAKIVTDGGGITSHQDISGKVDKTTTVNGHALSGNVSVSKSDVGLGNVTNDAQVKRSEMGAASGVATLDSNGKVPSSQLPSYVDDVIEGYFYNSKFYKESAHTTEITGETGKIYVDLSTNKTYRWGGSAYAVISETLALGETSSTAYRGDRGKTAYTHSQTTSGNPHNVTKSDVGLGNVGNFKAVSTVASQGLTDTEKSNARTNIGAGTSSFSGSYNDLSNKPTIPAAAANGTYTVKTLVGSTTTNVSDFTANQSSADDVTFVQGSNVTITPDATNRKITIAAKDTTYSSKAAASGGTDVSLVTTGEKYTWNSKTSNTGTVTKVSAGTGLTGGDITTTGTIALATSGVTAGTYKRVTVDAYGRVTSGDNTDSDTKNTAGTTNKTGTKMFLAAATSQAANPQTYSNSNCYIGTDNCLYSGGAKVLTSHQSLSNYYTKTQVDALTRHTRLTDFDLNVLKQAVADQNLEKYGLKVGDQKTINGHTYVIAGLNCMKGTNSDTVNVNHVGLIVIPHTTQKWNKSGNTYTGSDSRGAGYLNCDLHYYLKNTVLPLARTDLGASNLIAHNKLLSSYVENARYNRLGTDTGCSSDWTYSNEYISALSEIQVYGSIVWSSSGCDTGEACQQLEVFKHYKYTDIFEDEYPWLRDIVSATHAAFVNDCGYASHMAVSTAYSVAGLILFH